MISKKAVFLFVFSGIGIFLGLMASSSLRQGWFAPHEEFYIEFPSGDGLGEGTPVSISGLKAGRVTAIDLAQNTHVLVKISVQRKYALRIREDSKATVGRPFIIGEKSISISAGSDGKEQIKPGSRLQGEENLEITDLLSGGRLGPYMQTVSKLMEDLRIVIEGDGTPQSADLITLYKQTYKSLKSIDLLAHEIESMRREVVVTPETKKILRDVSKSTDQMQLLLTQMNTAMPAVTGLSGDVAKLMPELSKTLSETTFTLQAMQKSFILRGAVSDLKEERAKDGNRRPASTSSP